MLRKRRKISIQKGQKRKRKIYPKGHVNIHCMSALETTEAKNQELVGAIPFCGEYPGPPFEDKFRSANQMDGVSIAGGGKMADS